MVGVGIDVSKGSLSVAIHGAGNPWEGTFENTTAGRKALVKVVKKRTKREKQVRAVVEPTATYHVAVAKQLVSAGLRVMVANPRRTKHFFKSRNQRAKTDRADSHALAAYALAMPFEEWQPPAASVEALRSVVRRRKQLVEMCTAEKARLKELRATGGEDAVIASVLAHIKWLNAQIKALAAQAVAIVKADASLWDWKQLLESIPGVGEITSLTVISELAYLNDDLDNKQLTAFVGLDPRPFQYGMMDAKRRISKAGNRHLRTALFLAAWTATKNSPHVRAWKEGYLARGKAKKLVNVACARRLLLTMNAMRRTNASWDGERFHALQESA